MAEPSVAVTWGAVLDELDARVTRMESGDLGALEGWSPPVAQPMPMTAAEQRRTREILARQHALSSVLRTRQTKLVASRSTARRPRLLQATTLPVYVDRLA